MAWNNISKYLEKFFIIAPPKNFYQNEVARALNEVLNANLSRRDVEYRFGVVYVKNSNPSVKNEIFLNKEKIIKLLSKKVKNNKIKDIRF